MAKYILARFVLLIAVMIGVSVGRFSIIELLPGDPVSVLLGPDARVRREDMAAIRTKYGLDAPAPIQYARWMGHVLTGDLGTSFRSGRSLTEELALRLPVTIELTALAAVLGTIPPLLVRLLAARRRDSTPGHLATLVTFLRRSGPHLPPATPLVLR